MVKVMALLRTVFLVLVVGYTFWVMPFSILFGSAHTQSVVAVSPDLVKSVARAAWLAIGWIAFETVIGWTRVGWANRAERKRAEAELAAARTGASGPPPAPPPPHR